MKRIISGRAGARFRRSQSTGSNGQHPVHARPSNNRTTLGHGARSERASERASKRAEFERNTFHWATSLNNSHSRWLRFPRSVQFLFRPAAILPDFFHPLLFVHRLSIESACVSLSFSLLSARKTTVVVWKKPAPRRRRRRRRNLSFYRLRTRHRTIILRILSTLCIYIYIYSFVNFF